MATSAADPTLLLLRQVASVVGPIICAQMEIAPQSGICLEAHKRWHTHITIAVLQRSLRVRSTVPRTHLRPLLTSLGLECSRPPDGLDEVVPRTLVAATDLGSGVGGIRLDRWEMHFRE